MTEVLRVMGNRKESESEAKIKSAVNLLNDQAAIKELFAIFLLFFHTF